MVIDRMSDNRVCMFYILERLHNCIEVYNPDGDSSHLMLVELDELRTELLYNLGINAMLNHMNEQEKELN